MARPRPVVGIVGTHDPSFTLIALLAEGLRMRGFDVQVSAAPAWGATGQRVADARRGIANPGLAIRLADAYRRLFTRLRTLEAQPDILLVGYPGQLDLLALRLARIRQPIVLDGFIAIDETLADRGLASDRSVTRRVARVLDRASFALSDHCVVDTHAHGRGYSAAYGLDLARTTVVPVGAADPGAERPIGEPGAAGRSDRLRVLYFGGYIPLHGIDVILESARRLGPNAGVTFTLVGDGQEAPAAAAFIKQHQLTHVRMVRTWMPEQELIEHYVSPSDVCLGIFANSPKALDVVPAKVYLSLAAGRATLSGLTPAVAEELLARSEGAAPLATCRPGDPDDLAAVLLRLRDHPDERRQLAIRGRQLYDRWFRPEQIVEPLLPVLHQLAS